MSRRLKIPFSMALINAIAGNYNCLFWKSLIGFSFSLTLTFVHQHIFFVDIEGRKIYTIDWMIQSEIFVCSEKFVVSLREFEMSFWN